MSRPPTVADDEIIAAAEEILTEQEGCLAAVSGIAVRERAGGGAARVQRIVRDWKASKACDLEPASPEVPLPPLPEAVSTQIGAVLGTISTLETLLARQLDAVRRDERERAEQHAASERETAEQRLADARAESRAAREELDGYAEQLDRCEQQIEELAAERDALHGDLTEEQERCRALAAEVQTFSRRLIDAQTEHRDDLIAERAALDAFATTLRRELREMRTVAPRHERVEALPQGDGIRHPNEAACAADTRASEDNHPTASAGVVP